MDVVRLIGEQGMIPVLYNSDPEILKKVVKACYAGGARLFEFTNRGDFAHEVFASVNKWAAKEIPDMMLGVGSVMDAGTSTLYMQMGAEFIVSPVLKEEMALVCNRRKVLWIPGCGSATEISRAEELGAEIVKMFPGSAVGGPNFVKSVLGPSPWSMIMPTGFVEATEENLRPWFNSGVYCVGMGSNLITSEIIKKGDFKLLEKNTKEALELIKRIRK
jgi:2-dehydro-3-deoxyphosphogluconate aldolase/(4S)-4-hydroxy-2-oxoglutarate aldolase